MTVKKFRHSDLKVWYSQEPEPNVFRNSKFEHCKSHVYSSGIVSDLFSQQEGSSLIFLPTMPRVRFLAISFRTHSLPIPC
jgi:hypothetical protein